MARFSADEPPLPFFVVAPLMELTRRPGFYLKSTEKLLDFPSRVFLSKCGQNHDTYLLPRAIRLHAGVATRQGSCLARITGAFAPSLCVFILPFLSSIHIMIFLRYPMCRKNIRPCLLRDGVPSSLRKYSNYLLRIF